MIDENKKPKSRMLLFLVVLAVDFGLIALALVSALIWGNPK